MHKGLGDTVEAITKATGIKAVVDAVSEALDVDCGCSKRKEALNRIVPYRREIISMPTIKKKPFNIVYANTKTTGVPDDSGDSK